MVVLAPNLRLRGVGHFLSLSAGETSLELTRPFLHYWCVFFVFYWCVVIVEAHTEREREEVVPGFSLFWIFILSLLFPRTLACCLVGERERRQAFGERDVFLFFLVVVTVETLIQERERGSCSRFSPILTLFSLLFPRTLAAQ